jgi:hypothetical protein
MDLQKTFQGFATQEFDNQFVVTPYGDTAGSLAGKYFTFYAKDASANMRKFYPYVVSGGVGADPTLGIAEGDSIIVYGDSGGTTASKYFRIYDGTSTSATSYYTYFIVNNSGTYTGYDPRSGQYLITSISVIGDTNANLGGKYFKANGAAGAGDSYYAYYIIDDNPGYSADPRLGQAQVSTLTVNRAGDTTLNGNYFKWGTPASGYYTWYNNGNGVNPKVGRAQIQTLACTGDTSGNAAGKYWLIGDSAARFYVWYQVGGGGANPSLAGYSGILTSLASGDSSGTVALKTKTAVLVADSIHFGITRIANTLTITNVKPLATSVVFNGGTTNYTATITTPGIPRDQTLGGDSAVGAGDSVRYVNGDSVRAIWNKTLTTMNAIPGTVIVTTADSLSKYISWTNSVKGNATLSTDGIYPTGFSVGSTKKGFNVVNGLKNQIPVHIYTNAPATAVASATSIAFNQNFPSIFTTSLLPSGDTVSLMNDVGGAPTIPADGAGLGATSFKFVTNQAGVAKVAALANAALIAGVVVNQGDSNGTVANRLAQALNLAGWSSSRIGAVVSLTHKSKGNPATGIANGTMPIGWYFNKKGGALAPLDPVFTGGDSGVSFPIVINKGDSKWTIAQDIYNALNNNQYLFNYLITPSILTSGDTVSIANRWKGTVSAPADGSAPFGTGWKFVTSIAGSDSTSTNMGGKGKTFNYYIKPTQDQIIFLRKGIIEISLKGDTAGAMSSFGYNTIPLTNGLVIQVEGDTGAVVKLLTPVIKTNAQLATLGNATFDSNRMSIYLNFTDLYGGDAFGELPIDGTRKQRLNVKMSDTTGITPNFYAHFYGHYTTSGTPY